MKKIIALMLALLTAAPLLAGCGDEKAPETTTATSEPEVTLSPEEETLANATNQIEALSGSLTSNAAVTEMRKLVWEEYAAKVKLNESGRASEIKKNKTTKIKLGNTTMKVMTKVVGKAPEGGYPLFLVYHGGGYDPNNQYNEDQWSGMAARYTSTRVPGIYCAVRSVSDKEVSGQIFSTSISWQFYDRIIEDAILFMNANPNQVYIVGYSAGGDGVYQIAPRITDRLAAANMTAGHPNGIDLTNLYNIPFFLQVGELDPAYDRNTMTVEYDQKLDALAEKYGGGYEHYCFVHAGKEHGVVGDNATNKQNVIADVDAWLAAQKSGGTYTGGKKLEQTNAANLMSAYTRNPLPTRVIWNTATTADSNKARKLNSFYWLATDAKTGTIDISYDKESNTITVASCSIKKSDITIYLNEEMVDLTKPVTLNLPGDKTETFTPEISLDLLRTTTADRGDPNYQFCSSYTFKIG